MIDLSPFLSAMEEELGGCRVNIQKVESFVDVTDGKTVIRGLVIPLDAYQYFAFKFDEETDPDTDWQTVAGKRAAFKIKEALNGNSEKDDEV